MSVLDDTPLDHCVAPGDAHSNDLLADDIRKETWFKIAGLPEKLVVHLQVVNVVLLALEITLILSNNVQTSVSGPSLSRPRRATVKP
jgi:hypothetical protein